MTSSLPIPAPPDFALDHKRPEWCLHCGGVQIFIPCIYTDEGIWGVCWGCDKEVFVGYTRVNSEAGVKKAADLFCKAGGASMGLHLAGFEVTGFDIEPQPRYPFRFVQMDALYVDLSEFDFAWASPPCQKFTLAGRSQRARGVEYPDLIDAVRQKLIASGIPWVIENVPGAPVRADFILCGSQFGLPIARHRLFECSFTAGLTSPCQHVRDIITICGHGTPQWMRQRRIARGLHPNASVAVKKAAMEIDWMNRGELSQAIPPAYARFIADRFLEVDLETHRPASPIKRNRGPERIDDAIAPILPQGDPDND